MPFDPAASCHSSVKEHYADNPTKNINHGVPFPNFPAFNAVQLMYTYKVWISAMKRKAAEWTWHPFQVSFSFHFFT